ncbi:sugar ABC transporter permease [Actinomadura yumaensis]|uniref:ABC transporter permease subunit n=1 Tax=Actinomadura TaxID=1988 RepID=UPI0019D6AA44|nr:sugar ABC transporter permease [Actinomadura sp. J1-007]
MITDTAPGPARGRLARFARLARPAGPLAAAAAGRLRGGDLGALPVVAALAVIAAVFGTLNGRFLSAENLTNLALQMAATGTIALGVVIVLLLGEIDLSVGSVSGLCAVVMTVLNVRHGVPAGLAVLLALGAAVLVGLLHGLMFTMLAMPSFVVTLSGLIGWQGLLLYLLGHEGTVNLPFDGPIARLSDTWLPAWLSWLAVAALAAAALAAALVTRRLRARADLPVPPLGWALARAGALAAVLAAVVAVLNGDRGVPLTLVIFGSLVVLLDLALRGTAAGRWIYAVGGSAEAARRAGISVTRIRILGFAAASLLAGAGASSPPAGSPPSTRARAAATSC